MIEITLDTELNLDAKSRAWKTVQGMMADAPFGVVPATMNQGGLRGHSFPKMAGKAFREAMRTILGFPYSGKIDFVFAEYSLQKIILH